FRLNHAEGAERVAWNRKLDAMYRHWELRRNVIRARLLAYYSEGRVLMSWDRLTRLLLLLQRSAARNDASPFSPDDKRLYRAIVGKPLGVPDDAAWVTAMVTIETLRDKAVARVLN